MEAPFAAYAGDEPFVFVCYAHEDRDVVYPEMAWLSEQGLNLWYDEGISAGKNWRAVIGDSLLRASHVLVYISEQSLKSDHCNREINLALDERKSLVPMYIEDVELTSDLKVGLNRVQALRRENPGYRQQLLNALGQASSAKPILERKKPIRSQRRVLVGLVAAVLLSIGVWYLQQVGSDSLSKEDHISELPTANTLNAVPIIRVELQLEGWEDWKVLTTPAPSMVISADGKNLAFIARNNAGVSSLKVRRLNELDTIELAGTEGAVQPFFSPDGKWIGYFDGDLMKRISLEGGEPSIITSVVGEKYGASWGPDDRIYYAPSRAGLASISVSEGEYRVETKLDLSRGEGSHRLPHYLPGHELLLFSMMIDDSKQIKHETWVLNLATGERQYLFDGLAPAFVESGYIIYAKAEIGARRAQEVAGGSLWAVPFDPDASELTGPPRSIQNAIAGREGTAYAVSRSGMLVFLPKQGETFGELVLLDSDGSQVLVDGPSFEHPQFSNDGKSIAVSVIEEGKAPAIWVYGVDSNVKLKIADNARFPLWDSDDQRLTFMKVGTGLVRQPLRNPKGFEILVPHEQLITPNAWISQTNTLLYFALHPDRGGWTYKREVDKETQQRLIQKASQANLTSDERWVAFCTWPSGIQVGSFPEISSTTTLTDSGCTPHWGNGDTRIYYQDFNKLWAVSVEKNIEQGPVFGKSEFIADLGYPGISLFDIDHSGRIVIARHRDTAPKQPVLLINWESKLN